MAADLLAAVERDHPRRAVLADSEDLAGGEHLGSEAAGLRRRAPREIGAAEAGGEAQVVLDARALARLPAGRVALDEQGPQALGRPVDGGRQAGRPAAEDHEVVEGEIGVRVEADARGDVALGRLHERLAVLEDEHRQARVVEPGGIDEPACLRVVERPASGKGCRSGRGSHAWRAPRRRTGAPPAAGPAPPAGRRSPPPSPRAGRRARGRAAPPAGSRASSGSGRGGAR